MLAEDTLVLTADQGWKLLREPVRDSRAGRARLPTVALLPPVDALGRAHQDAYAPMFNVILEAGFQVTCTADHEFAVIEDGLIKWRALRDLVVGGSVVHCAGWELHGPDAVTETAMRAHAQQYLRDATEALEPHGDAALLADERRQPSPLHCPSAEVRRGTRRAKRRFLQCIADQSIRGGWLTRDPHITVASEHIARYIHAEMLNMNVIGHVRMLDWRGGVSRIANRVYWTWSVQARAERERLRALLKCPAEQPSVEPHRIRGSRAIDGCEALLANNTPRRANAIERQLVREVVGGRARLTDVRMKRLVRVLPHRVIALQRADLWTTAIHQIEPVGRRRGFQTPPSVRWLVAWGALTRQPTDVFYKRHLRYD